jgi:hypothetical protein
MLWAIQENWLGHSSMICKIAKKQLMKVLNVLKKLGHGPRCGETYMGLVIDDIAMTTKGRGNRTNSDFNIVLCTPND